jgi:hypothetical protein
VPTSTSSEKVSRGSAKDTPAWYADTRAREEARGTLEQAEVLGRVLEQLGEWLGE